MKKAICSLCGILTVLLAIPVTGSGQNLEALSPDDSRAATNFFALFDSGKSKLSDLRDETNSPLRNKIISFYKTSTNQLSLEHQYVVAMCMLAEAKDFQVAAKIADVYVSENPTNGRGWMLLGATMATVKNVPRSIQAYEKAMEFGQSNAVTSLCGIALGYGDDSVIQKHLPELLAEFETNKNEKDLRQDALGIIVVYAMKNKNEELF